MAFDYWRSFRAAVPDRQVWTDLLVVFEPRLKALREVRQGAPQAALVLEAGLGSGASFEQQVQVIRYLVAPIRLVPLARGEGLPILAMFVDDATLADWAAGHRVDLRMKLGDGAAVLGPKSDVPPGESGSVPDKEGGAS